MRFLWFRAHDLGPEGEMLRMSYLVYEGKQPGMIPGRSSNGMWRILTNSVREGPGAHRYPPILLLTRVGARLIS